MIRRIKNWLIAKLLPSGVVTIEEDYKDMLENWQYKINKSVFDGEVRYVKSTLCAINGCCSYARVSMIIDGELIPIKFFKDEDTEYNQVCADELVELLRQKQ